MYAMIELTEADTEVSSRSPREPVVQTGIHAYQAGWEQGFRVEAELLARSLSSLSPRVEHIGTTSVPGSAARPIIDILVGVAQPSAVHFLLESLRVHGYRAGESAEATAL